MNLNKSFGGDDTKAKEWMKKHPTLVGIVFVLFIIAFYSFFVGSGEDLNQNDTVPTPKTQTEISNERKTISIAFAEKTIKDILKAPSTAKFVDVKAYELSNEKDVWAINGSVDSQNSFGAMIRNIWEVQLDYRDGKGGTVKSIFFDGKKML